VQKGISDPRWTKTDWLGRPTDVCSTLPGNLLKDSRVTSLHTRGHETPGSLLALHSCRECSRLERQTHSPQLRGFSRRGQMLLETWAASLTLP
jgi:hypothetical protein